MNAKNQVKKYHLLVLCDLSKAAITALKNAVQLAKVINGSVEVFHVRAPKEVVSSDNQFSAMREVHEDYYHTKTSLIALVKDIKKQEGVDIKYDIAYGNVKKEIKQKISYTQPEIVLLGKRKPKLIDYIKNGVTEFLFKECPANLLIYGEDHKFHSYNDLSLGIYGPIVEKEGIEIISDLKEQNSNPIRHFSIRNRKNNKSQSETSRNDREMISYIFSQGANALDVLASYVLRTNTQLLCIPKKGNNTSFFKLRGEEIPVSQVVRKLDIPVLIMR